MSVCLHVAFCVVKCSLVITNCFIRNTGNVNGQDPIMFFFFNFYDSRFTCDMWACADHHFI